ncbi:spermatoproteinsis associated 17 [Perkinsus chesapeaki]|uniref:Spermatoproteinsis associated 17 n=1 Tax=Perkinsus chesapeaki TaxID=330153 RepID=A0A7J6LN10_PERCH|nr:spermatoproteinsis associated 17 [Perkinsus chesapeaki]
MLTDSQLVQPLVKDLFVRFFQDLQAAEDYRSTETRAATDIQRIFRGAIIRFQYERTRRAIKLIQRVFRGHVGRTKAAAARTKENGRRQLAFFHAQAETIQRFFKGFWSRKYMHDFYAMKRYLAAVAERGEQSRSYLQEQAEVKLKSEEEETTRMQEAAIRKILSECGHLVSTNSCPGVYNPPYGKALPHVLGEPVEAQIRKYSKPKVVKSIRRPKPFEKSPPRMKVVAERAQEEEKPERDEAADLAFRKFSLSTVTANVGRRQPVQGPFRTRQQITLSNSRAENNFRSLTSSVSYDKVEQEIRMQKKISKLTHKGPGFRVMKPHVSRYGPTVQSDSLYSAPAEFRSDYRELPRIPGKEKFYVALESGKSFQVSLEIVGRDSLYDQDYTTDFGPDKACSSAASVPVLPSEVAPPK